MSNRLEGKVAIVTGAARGIGEATARLFAEQGARVVVTDVLDEQGKALAEELGDRAIFRHLDVSNSDDWAATVNEATSQFGRVDVLVNNAGISRYNTIDQMPIDELMAHLQINFVGAWLGSRAVLEPMRKAGSGSIVNIGSTNGFRGAAGGSAYNTSKFALHGLTQSLAVELGPFGIRVNVIAPGATGTVLAVEAMQSWFGEDAVDNSETGWSIPLLRMGEPRDIANMALFLASDESSYCTGGQFVVDGGMTADHPFKPAAAWLKHRKSLAEKA